ncbi:MAG: hypothetical protein WCT99_00855 [Bacteroidota bacterium]|jgi:uncharacterized protein involved in exopolysaccharide biosynthesis
MSEEQKSYESKDAIKEFIEKIAPYFRIVLQNWKKILYLNGAIAILSAAILLLFVKNYYDSSIVILPDYGGGSMLGSLSGLAAVAGISVGESVPTMIYQKLLEGEAVLEPVIYKKYDTREFDHPVNLIDYNEIELDVTNDSDPKFLQDRDKFLQMIKIFKEKMLMTDYDRNTSILTVTVRTHEPILSSEIVNNLVSSLDEFVRTKRKSNAKEQRIYIEKRTDQVQDSLRIAEETLKGFREKNRVTATPQLLLDLTRLVRNVDILQAVYIELTKQMELIKLEEVKDSPIINIREGAGIPVKKEGPKRAIYFILIMIFSLGLSTIWIIYSKDIFEYYKYIRKNLLITRN